MLKQQRYGLEKDIKNIKNRKYDQSVSFKDNNRKAL